MPELARAERQLAETQERIAHQLGIIEHLALLGAETSRSRSILDTLQALLRTKREYRDMIVRMIAAEKAGRR